jgi:hypothetical protein
MGKDRYFGTYRGTLKIPQGYPLAPVLPVPGIPAEEGRHAVYSPLGKGADRSGAGALDMVYRNG